MDGQDFMASAGLYFCLFSTVISSKLINLFIFYFYVFQQMCLAYSSSTCTIWIWDDSIKRLFFLSPLALSAILLTFSVNALCASLMNVRAQRPQDFSIIFQTCFVVLKFTFSFLRPFLCLSPFCQYEHLLWDSSTL